MGSFTKQVSNKHQSYVNERPDYAIVEWATLACAFALRTFSRSFAAFTFGHVSKSPHSFRLRIGNEILSPKELSQGFSDESPIRLRKVAPSMRFILDLAGC